jgi:hypothetical protein
MARTRAESVRIAKYRIRLCTLKFVHLLLWKAILRGLESVREIRTCGKPAWNRRKPADVAAA